MSKKIILSLVTVVTLITVYSLRQNIAIVSTTSSSVANQVQLAPASSVQPTNAKSNTNHLTQTIDHASMNNNEHTPTAIERIRALEERTELQDSVLQDHDNFKRYPEDNAAIADAEHDPVMQRYEIDERTTLSKDKSTGLTIWADKKFYLKNDTVTVFAFVQDNEGQKLSTNLEAKLLNNQQNTISKLTLSPTGDGSYQAHINLASMSKLDAGIYKVLISSPQHKLTDALTFTLTQPDIELTGEYKEHIDEAGQLVFEIQARVASPSSYYVQASLYSETGVAIGVAQTSTQLTAGLHWLALNYSGLMIQDAKENGPFVLQNVSLAKVTIPMMRAPLLQPRFVTQSYGLDEF